MRPVRAFVRDLDANLAAGRGLWFMGDVGTGKTTLAMLVSKAAIDAAHSVAIYSVPHLLAEIRDTYDRDPGERSYMDFFNRLVAVDLLHLEDLGTEKRTDWVLEQLYSLVNERYEQQRSILVTTNLSVPDLEEQIGAAHRVAHRGDVRRPATAVRRRPPHRLGPRTRRDGLETEGVRRTDGLARQPQGHGNFPLSGMPNCPAQSL